MKAEERKQVIKIIMITVVGVVLILLVPFLFSVLK